MQENYNMPKLSREQSRNQTKKGISKNQTKCTKDKKDDKINELVFYLVTIQVNYKSVLHKIIKYFKI